MSMIDDFLDGRDAPAAPQPAAPRTEIDDFLDGQRPPVANRSRTATPRSEIDDFLGPEPEKPGLARKAADLVLEGTRAGYGLVAATGSLFGADSPIAIGSRAIAEEAGNLQSPHRQAQRQQEAQRMEAAEQSGDWTQEVDAAWQNFKEAPAAHVAGAVGSAVPTVAAAMAGAALGPVAAVAAPVALGGAIGAGSVKSSIYEDVKRRHLEAGRSETDAEAHAVKAQDYRGDNLDQVALGAGIGAVAGGTGLERIAPAGAAGGIVRRAVTGALTEAVPEAIQGGQERVAANLAAQREGFDAPTWQGVAGQATTEGLAGGALGGMAGAARPSPSQQMGLDPAAGPLSAAAAQAVDTGAASPITPRAEERDVPPAGSFSAMNEFADLLAQERGDLDARRGAGPWEEMKGVDAGLPPLGAPLQQADAQAEGADKAGARATWRNQDFDLPVEVMGPAEVDSAGRQFAPVRGELNGSVSTSYVPADELVGWQEQAGSDPAANARTAVDPATGEILEGGPVDRAAELLARLAFVEQQSRMSGWDQRLIDERARVQSELAAIAPEAVPAPTQAVEQTPAARWAAMTAEDRAAVAGGTDLAPVIRRNLPAAQWERLNPKVQAKLEQAMQAQASPPPAERAPSAARAGAQLEQSQAQSPAAPAGGPVLGTAEVAPAFDVAGRTDAQLQHLATSGRPGWREAAQAEIARRAAPGTDGAASTPTSVQGVAPATTAQGGGMAVAVQSAGPAAPAIDSRDLGDGWAAFGETSGTLGVPRAEMPQIRAEHRGAMVKFMNARGVAHREETVAAASLKPTQAEFNREKVAKAKARAGGERSILVSADGHVLDGHHQWLAAREAGEPVKAIRLEAPIRDLITLAHAFPSSSTADGAATAPRLGQQWDAMSADERTAAAVRAGWATKHGAPNVIAKRHAGKAWAALGEPVRRRLAATLAPQGAEAAAAATQAAPSSPVARSISPAPGTGRLSSAQAVRDAVAAHLPRLAPSFDTMIARGTRGERGGAVVIEQADEASLAATFARHTGRSLAEARQDLQASLSAIKSVDANVRRGREALGKAVAERRSVHRAMYRSGLGWVDFVWGDAGRVKASGRSAGAMGLAHILEARQRKDGMTEADVLRLLDDLVTTLAHGTEIRRRERDGTIQAVVAHGDNEAVLVRSKGNNAWLLSGWRVIPGAGRAANDAPGATHARADSSDASMGAGLAKSIAQPMVDDNGALQGFYDPKSGLTFLVAPNLTAESAPAVLLHEVTHSQRRADIDAQALALIRDRDQIAMPAAARALLAEAEARMVAAGVEDAPGEATAYIVELATLQAKDHGFDTIASPFWHWVDATLGARLSQVLRDFVVMARQWGVRLGIAPKRITIDDLVAFAHAGVRAAAAGRVVTEAGPVQASRAPGVGAAARTAQQALQHPTQTLRRVRQWLGHQLRNHRGWMMGALTRDQIADLYGQSMPEVARFDRVVQDMDAERNRITEQADVLVERWRELPPEQADQLADVMHAATLAQFDPDLHPAPTAKPDPRAPDAAAEAQRVAAEAARQHAIIAQWATLSPEARQLYRDVRAQYRATLVQVRDGLAHRAQRTGSAGQRIADEIRLRFDDYLKQGPYFSLARFGDFILIANKGEERIVEAFESSFQRAQREEALRAQGWRTELTRRADYSASTNGAAGAFVGEVLERIDALNIHPKDKAALMDDLNQLAISTLPDASFRKHFAHRKGTPGFSNDAMRAFAQSQMHAAHHIARINHADELSLLIDEMDQGTREMRAASAERVDVTERGEVINELRRRLDQLMNPNTHPVTAALGQVGFVMSLAGSIASGVTNLTQTPMVTFPWLGARHGFDQAATALLQASRDYFGGRWDKWSGYVMKDNPNLSADERAALRELELAGVIDLTQMQDLAGTANTDHTVSRRAFAIRRAMKIIGWTFHTPEVFNRQVSALAAYRLGRETGKTHADAVAHARQALIRTHFDYSASNRARFMHGNFIRVISMFKQYSQQMTYLLWRNAYQALKGESPEVKREARRMLLGVGAMHFAAAGTLGLPLGVFGISPLLAVLAMGMGDEDDPWDWEVEYRNMLADAVGPELGEAIAHGPLRLLVNVDFASRVGLGDLWLRAPNKDAEGRDLVEAWMLTLLGPIAGYAGQMGTAVQAFSEGKTGRGFEAMLPKFAAAPLKAMRFADEGVRSWRGDDLGVALDAGDLFGAALGFQPARLAEMYEGRAAIKGREAALAARREEIINLWVSAQQAGDQTAMDEALEAALRFSQRNPGLRITLDTLRRSLQTKLRNASRIEAGAYLTPSRENLREFGRFANID